MIDDPRFAVIVSTTVFTVRAPGLVGDIRETPEKSTDRRLCFRVLARAGKGSQGMSAGNTVFPGESGSAEPFSEGRKEKPPGEPGG
jgi:hypothetical protein